ncbi:MAG: hypothetical protein AB7S44_01690 [Spirochaetales bacterium]
MGRLELRLEERGKTVYANKTYASGDSMPVVVDYDQDSYGLYDRDTNEKVSSYRFYNGAGMIGNLNTSFTYLPNGYYFAAIIKGKDRLVDVLINPEGKIEAKNLKNFEYLGNGQYSVTGLFGNRVVKEVADKNCLTDTEFLESGLSLKDMRRIRNTVLASEKPLSEMTFADKVQWEERRQAKLKEYLKGYTYDDLSGATTGKTSKEFDLEVLKIKRDTDAIRYYESLKETNLCLDVEAFAEELKRIEADKTKAATASKGKVAAVNHTVDVDLNMA